MTAIVPEGYGISSWVLESSVGTAPFITTCGVFLEGYGTEYVDAANFLFSAYADAWIPSTSADLTLTQVILSVGVGGGDAPTVLSTSTAVPGASTGDFLPINNSLLLNKRSSLLGRKGRGRMFIPGVLRPAQVNVSGNLGTTTLDAFNAVADDFYNTLTIGDPPDSGTAPMLLHSTPVPAPTPITGFVISSKIGSMRKRIR